MDVLGHQLRIEIRSIQYVVDEQSHTKSYALKKYAYSYTVEIVLNAQFIKAYSYAVNAHFLRRFYRRA